MSLRFRTLLFLISGFVVFEIVFAFLVAKVGNGDLLGSFIKSVVLIVVIGFYANGIHWLKWILSVLLLLQTIACILAGIGEDNLIFFTIAIYSLFFIYCIHGLKSLKVATIQPEESVSRSPRKVIYTARNYPLLLVRYKALFIDGIFLLILMVLVMIIMDEHEARTPVMITLSILIALLYEPLLMTFSKTLGQRAMKIKVRKYSNPAERISLLNSYVRSLTKGTLGWLSLITINFNPHHRAIHDIISNSIVLNEENSESIS
jgi:hypothetical protein